MKLFDLAFACYIYRYKADDKSYLGFLKGTDYKPDLSRQDHRFLLIEWLRNWGCRQFAKEYDALVSEEIKDWYKNFKSFLPKSTKNLIELSPNEIDDACIAYENLKERTASKRKIGKRISKVRIGATGAAKALFILRPDSLILWDSPIRENLKLDGESESYKKYLYRAISDLQELEKDCRKAHISFSGLPKELGRPNSSLVKMVDEYYWITETNGFVIPTSSDLADWSKWKSL